MRDTLFHVDLPDDAVAWIERHRAADDAPRVAVLVQVAGPVEAEADRNLAQVLDVLVERHGIRLVCTENYAGDVDFRKTPATTAVPAFLARQQSSSKLFLHRLRDTKSLRTAITRSRESLRVVGVDDLGAHAVMVEVQQRALAAWPRFRPLFEALAKMMDEAVARCCTPAARELLLVRRRYAAGSLGLAGVLAILDRLSAAHRVTLPENVRMCIGAVLREAVLDEERIKAEKKELVERIRSAAGRGLAAHRDLAAAMPRGLRDAAMSIGDAVDVTVAHAKGELGGRDRHHTLVDEQTAQQALSATEILSLATTVGIDTAPYAQFLAWAGYVRFLTRPGVDFTAPAIAEAIAATFRRLGEALFGSAQARALWTAERRLYLLHRLAEVTLDNDLYDALLADLDACDLQHVLAALTEAGTTVPPQTRELAKQFDATRDGVRRFYDCARVRGVSMAQGTIDRMKQQRTGEAVLLCLGFHLHTVRNVLEASGVSYAVITPRFTLR